MLYLREIMDSKDPDPVKLSGGGEEIDIGGFENIVHKHDLSNQVSVGVSMSLDGDGLWDQRLVAGMNRPSQDSFVWQVEQVGIKITVSAGRFESYEYIDEKLAGSIEFHQINNNLTNDVDEELRLSEGGVLGVSLNLAHDIYQNDGAWMFIQDHFAEYWLTEKGNPHWK